MPTQSVEILTCKWHETVNATLNRPYPTNTKWTSPANSYPEVSYSTSSYPETGVSIDTYQHPRDRKTLDSNAPTNFGVEARKESEGKHHIYIYRSIYNIDTTSNIYCIWFFQASGAGLGEGSVRLDCSPGGFQASKPSWKAKPSCLSMSTVYG